VVKKVMLSLEIKQEIVEKHERGVRVSELAKQYDRNMSTISTILKQKEACLDQFYVLVLL